MNLVDSKLEIGRLRECDSVKTFADGMKRRDVYAWWRKGMGFDGRDI